MGALPLGEHLRTIPSGGNGAYQLQVGGSVAYILAIAAMTAKRSGPMATLTVRNLDDAIVRRLRIRAAEHGRSAEAEHREILRVALGDGGQAPTRLLAAERLEEFRRRTARRGSAPGAELLQQARTERLRSLAGDDEGA